MPAVSRAIAAPRAVSPARTTDLLKVKVTENDPTLKAAATLHGFKVTGSGSNDGVLASFCTLAFDHRTVKLSVNRGDTGLTLFKRLQKALPTGYQARVLEQTKSAPPQVTIGISKKTVAQPR